MYQSDCACYLVDSKTSYELGLSSQLEELDKRRVTLSSSFSGTMIESEQIRRLRVDIIGILDLERRRKELENHMGKISNSSFSGWVQ